MESSVVLNPSTDIKGNFKLSRGRGFQLCAMKGDNESNKIFDQFLDLEDSVSGDDEYCFERLDFLNKDLSK